MDRVFGFFLRLLLCFLAAKFILRAVDLEGWRSYLVGLSLLFLANLYGIEYLVFREGSSWRRYRSIIPRPQKAAPAAAAPETEVPPESGPAEPPPAPAGNPEETASKGK